MRLRFDPAAYFLSQSLLPALAAIIGHLLYQGDSETLALDCLTLATGDCQKRGKGRTSSQPAAKL